MNSGVETNNGILQAEDRHTKMIRYENRTYRVGIVEVTPELAGEWLKANTKNRPLNARSVRRYARSMRERQWALNGETIVFDDRGRVLSAQHRLTSCIEANETFVTFVVWGVDEKSYLTIDSARKRTCSDALSIEGAKHANVLASAARWLLKYRTGNIAANSESYGNQEILELVNENPELTHSVSISLQTRDVVGPGIASFCHFIFSKINRVEADEFMVDLARGSGLDSTDPVWSIRERFIRQRSMKTVLPPTEAVAIIFKAWNYRRKGRRLAGRGFCWRSSGPMAEPFPEPI